jgi:hypothetical protein
MKKLLFGIILIIAASVTAFGQRENLLPMKGSSLTTDTMRVIKDNQSALMLRSTWQGDLYDSLAAHTDTLQALRADIDAGGSSLLLDSINQHRVEIDNLHDSIAVHRTELDNHTDSIADHRAELDNLSDSIADHRTELDANTSQIASNGTNISTNSVGILDNQNDIASLEDSISKHTDTLQVHQDQIAALYDTAAIHLDTLQLHRVQIEYLNDSIAVLRADIDVLNALDSTWVSITTDTVHSSGSLIYLDTSVYVSGNVEATNFQKIYPTTIIMDDYYVAELGVSAVYPQLGRSTLIPNTSSKKNYLDYVLDTIDVVDIATTTSRYYNGTHINGTSTNSAAKLHFQKNDLFVHNYISTGSPKSDIQSHNWNTFLFLKAGDTINVRTVRSGIIQLRTDTPSADNRIEIDEGKVLMLWATLDNYVQMDSLIMFHLSAQNTGIPDDSIKGYYGIYHQDASPGGVGVRGSEDTYFLYSEYGNNYLADSLFLPDVPEAQTAKSLYYDEVTGLVTYGDTVTGGGGGAVSDSSWSSIQVDTISELTASHGVFIPDLLIADSINLGVAEYLTFGNGSGYIYAPLNNSLVIGANGSNVLTVNGSDNSIAGTFRPSLNSVYDLGTSARFWQATYTDSVIIDNTSNYITEDGSTNMVFHDAVTGSKTLAELAAAGGVSDSSWVSITVDSISELTSTNGVDIEGIHFEDNDIDLRGGTTTGRLYFDQSENHYIARGSGTQIQHYVAGSNVLNLYSSGTSYINTNFAPFSNHSRNLGTSSYFWAGAYIDRVYFETTSTYINEDASSNLSFTDGNAGTIALTDLATGYEYQNINEQTTSGYTLVLTDAGALIDYDYDGGAAISVPPNSSVAFPIGTRIRISKTGTSGNVNINEGSGVTINHWETAPAVRNMGTGELIKIGTDEWMLTGDIIQDA